MEKATPLSRFAISSSSTIEEALKTITLNRRGAVLIVDKRNKVLGIASDGDIRRALVRGISVMASITQAMNTNIVFIKKGSEDDKNAGAFFKSHPNITLLPVVTSDFILSHLYKLPDPRR